MRLAALAWRCWRPMVERAASTRERLLPFANRLPSKLTARRTAGRVCGVEQASGRRRAARCRTGQAAHDPRARHPTSTLTLTLTLTLTQVGLATIRVLLGEDVRFPSRPATSHDPTPPTTTPRDDLSATSRTPDASLQHEHAHPPPRAQRARRPRRARRRVRRSHSARTARTRCTRPSARRANRSPSSRVSASAAPSRRVRAATTLGMRRATMRAAARSDAEARPEPRLQPARRGRPRWRAARGGLRAIARLRNRALARASTAGSTRRTGSRPAERRAVADAAHRGKRQALNCLGKPRARRPAPLRAQLREASAVLTVWSAAGRHRRLRGSPRRLFRRPLAGWQSWHASTPRASRSPRARTRARARSAGA